MTKKIVLAVVSVILIIAISLGIKLLMDNKTVPTSTTIENGLSAYELAVQYGYEGTVQEWLESLEGKSAYQIAVDSGYSGTEAEWLASLKATANNVANIKDAEFNSKGELVLTLSDDTVLNLGVAVGANGADGKDGKDGADGKDGTDGISITTASINENGQLVLSFSDGQTVNLDTVVGVNGKDGISVIESKINSKGELVISYSNGQEANLGIVIGAKGDKGDKGDAGAAGKDGKDGKDGIDAITSTVINDNGELVITYSNGTTDNLGIVVGRDGINGQNGQNGADGKDGISVTGAEITSDGELVLTYSNNQRSNLGKVIGADGKDGQDGAAGQDGADGQDGVSVTKSEINSKGELVITYSDNTVDNLGVVVGVNGKDGTDGTDGKDGANGKDGVGIKNIVISNSDELVITLTNDSTLNLGCIKGADGQDGTDGTNGVDGKDGISVTGATINASNELVLTFSDNTEKNLGIVVGDNGKDGVDGANGKDGVGIKKTEVNALGELVITYTDDTTDNLGVIVSDNGGAGTSANAPRVQINSTTNEWEISTDGGKTYVSTGIKATGNDGQDGADGKTPYIKDGNWWIGDTDTGVKAEGTNGTNGNDGEDGKDGVGVSGAEINSEDHLIIKLSDNTTIDVGVVVGADGKDGTNGKDGADGKNGVGIKNVTVSDDGILTVMLDNDTVLTLGNIKGKDGVGIAKTEINSEGKLVITYTDDKVVTLDKVVGDDGVGIAKAELTDDYMLELTFTNGGTQTVGPIRGEKGADGVGIKDISVGDDGYLYVTFDNSDEAQKIAYIKGDKGDKGDSGVDGKTPYILNGTWWIGETNTGVKAEGVDGTNGTNGTNGVGVQNAYVNSELHLIIVLTDGTEIDAGYVGVSESSTPLTKFTVTFKDHDGTVLKTEEVESGEAATAPSNPTRTGYTFTGWNQSFSNVISDMVIVAQYQKITAPTIEVSNVTASAGETIQITISLINNPGITTFMPKVSFDEAILTLNSITYNTAFGGAGMPPEVLSSPVNILWDDSSDNQTNDVLVTLTFTVKNSATSGSASIVNVSYNAGEICNFNEENVEFDIMNGKVTIK